MQLILALLLTVLFSGVGNAAPIKVGIYALGTATTEQRTFMKTYFDWIMGSSTLFPTAGDFSGRTGEIAEYLDAAVTYSLANHLEMYDWALSKFIDPEEMLLHARRDLYTGLNPTWSSVDKFDGFENANGIMRDSGSFTDLTATAYSGSITWSDTIYVGYQLPFDQMNLTLTTAGTGITKIWEYWNGSAWTTLTVTDGTSNFALSGQVAFTPPGNWARTVVNGSRNKYFVRCRFTAATTSPVSSAVKGDDWAAVPTVWSANSTNSGQYSYALPTSPNGYVYYNKTGGTSAGTEPVWPTSGDITDGTITWKTTTAGYTSRGWDQTSGTIVNSGELAYNPTPPAYATAKFRYQSRITGWGVNRHWYNLADKQVIDGSLTRTSAAWVASVTAARLAALPFTALMFDDVATVVNIGGITPKATQTDFIDKAAGRTPAEVDTDRYQDLLAIVSAAHPTIKFGGNTYEKATVQGNGHFNLYEYMNYTYKTGDNVSTKLLTTDSATAMCYDNYLTGTQKGFTIFDDATSRGIVAGWDNASRGPLVALTKHLIGMNDNTIFGYVSYGNAYYSERDEVTLLDNSHVHLGSLQPSAWPTTAQVKRWGVFFPAMKVDFGTPGIRNMEWAKAADYGWSTLGSTMPYDSNVWGRDFSNALVLHRSSGAATYLVDFATYSVPLDLGGTYYPLSPDGTIGAGITSIQLRREEGAILMKSATLPPTGSSCSDGILNGTETGVDCGGSCSACAVPPPVVITGSRLNANLRGLFR